MGPTPHHCPPTHCRCTPCCCRTRTSRRSLRTSHCCRTRTSRRSLRTPCCCLTCCRSRRSLPTCSRTSCRSLRTPCFCWTRTRTPCRLPYCCRSCQSLVNLCHYVFCPTALSPHCGKKGYIFFTAIDHCGNELFRVIQLSNTKNSHLETPKRYYYLNPFIIEKFELHVIFAYSYFCGTFQLIFRKSLRKIS